MTYPAWCLGIAFLSALFVVQIDHCFSSEDLGALGHEFDLAALNLLQSYEEEEQRISSRSRISVQNLGQDTLVFNPVIPVQKFNTSSPMDIQHIKLKVNSTAELHLLAVANHLSPKKEMNSTIDIYQFDKNSETFVMIHQLYQKGPYKLEHCNVTSEDGKVKNLLVVASSAKGSSETNTNPHICVYEIVLTGETVAFRLFQELHLVSVDALTSFVRNNVTYLVMALSLKPAMITDYPGSLVILSHNRQKDFFQYHSSIESNVISDVEVVTIGKLTLMAVGYSKDKDNNRNLNSTVFKYNDGQGKFEFYQSLPTKGGRSIESFHILNSHFLVVASELCSKDTDKCTQLPSNVYTLVGSKFQLFFDVKQDSPILWKGADLERCQNARVFAYADRSKSVDQVGFYVYREGNRMFEKLKLSLYQSYSPDFRPEPNALALFTIDKKLFLAVGSNNNSVLHSLYRIPYTVTPNENAWELTAAKLSSELFTLQGNLTLLEESIEQLEIQVNNVMKTHVLQNVTGAKTFAKNVTFDTVNIEEMHLTDGSILFLRNGTFHKANDVKYTFENLTELEGINGHVKALTSERNISVSKAPKIDEKNSFHGAMNFSIAHVNSSTVLLNNVNIPDCVINDVSVCFLSKDIVTSAGDQSITGRKTFAAHATMLKSLHLKGNLNGIRVSQELIDVKNAQTAYSNKTFDDVIFLGSVNVTKKLSGVDVTELLRLGRSEIISGINTFSSSLELDLVNVKQRIDGTDFDVFSRNAMILNKRQNITGRKSFRKGVGVDGDVQVENKTNNHDLDTWSAGLAKVNVPLSRLNEKVTILDEVEVKGNITLVGQLNGLNFPADVFSISERQQVQGRKVFASNISSQLNVIATGLVDNVNMSDTVSLQGNESIFGKKLLIGDFNASSNVQVSENTYVDSVDISHLQQHTVFKDGKQNITDNTTFTSNATAMKCLITQNRIGQLPVKFYDELFAKSVLKLGSQTIHGKSIFTGNVSINRNTSVEGEVNRYSFPESFLNNFGNQQISSTFTLNDVFLKDKCFIGGPVGNFSMNRLDSIVTSTKSDKPVFGKKTFNEDVNVTKGVNVSGTVNSANLSSLLTKDTNQVITEGKRFKVVQVKGGLMAETRNVSVKTTIDAVDLSEFSKKAWLDNSYSPIDSTLYLENVTITNGLQTERVNNIDLKGLVDELVTLNSDQMITGRKEIRDLIARSDVLTKSLIDNIDVSDLSDSILRINENTVQNGKVKLGGFSAARLEISGSIHGSKLSDVVENTVMTSEDSVLKDEKTISGTARIRRNVIANMVNALVPSKDWVLKEKSQVISGKKTFSSDIRMDGNVLVDGEVNGLDVVSMENAAVLKTKPGNIGGIKILAMPTESKSHVTVEATIDGVDLSELDKVTAKLNRDAVFTGNRTFTEASKFNAILSSNGLVNEKDILSIRNDAVMTNGGQNVTGALSFENTLLVQSNLTVHGNITSSGIVNQVQISDLEKSVVKKDLDQTISGTKTFARDAIFRASVETLRLNAYGKEEFVYTSGDQSIEGKKVIAQINATGNVVVSELVDGRDLSQLAVDTLLTTDNQKITGQKNFRNTVTLKSSLFDGLLDSRSIDPNTIMTLGTDQKVNGRSEFLSSTTATTDIAVRGKVTGVNITALERKRVKLNETQTISAGLFGTSFRVKEEIQISDKVNKLDFGDWKNSLDTFKGNSTSYRKHLDAVATSRCPHLNHTKDVLENSPFSIDHFDSFQEFDNYNYHMEPFVIGNDSFIATVRAADAVKSCLPSEVLKYNSSLGRFVSFQYLAKALDSKFRSFRSHNDSYLLLESGSLACNQGKSVLYKWNSANQSFEERQTFPMSSVADCNVFQDSTETTWMVIATQIFQSKVSNVTLWKKGANDLIFTFSTVLPSKMPSSIEAFNIGNQTFLAIAMSYDPVLSTASTLSVIYKLKENGEWKLLQNIPTTRASDVTSFKDREHHFVAFSNEQDKNSLSSFTQQVEILRYLPSEGQFVLDHSFGSLFPMGIETISLAKVNYLVVVMKNSGINIYRLRLHFAYQLTTFLPQPTVTHVSSLMIGDQLLLAISSKVPTKSADSGMHKPRLLRAVVSGMKSSSSSGC